MTLAPQHSTSDQHNAAEMSPQQLAEKLVDCLSGYRHVLVAFSGGVDSSVVAAAAVRANLVSLRAVTAKSPSVAKWQLELASKVTE